MNKLFLFLSFIAIGCYRLQAQNIELSSLNGTTGLVMSSIAGFLTEGKVNYAGDINKDGFNDVLISLDYDLFLIYGNNGTSQVNLSNVTSDQGFSMLGASSIAFSGTGDVNGDNIDDLIIGNGDNSACVIFGSQLPFPSALNLTECNNATFGIQISGCPDNTTNFTGCGFPFVISGAGDINGDNIQDILLSADLVGLTNRTAAGLVYVIYGNKGGLSNINLTNLTSTQGFSIMGPATESYIGTQVSTAGDVNGDGIDDIIMASSQGNPTYVIYGNTNGFSNMDLANFNSTQGFTISFQNSSVWVTSVSTAGDVNGDQIYDLLIGLATNILDTGMAYVLYGGKNIPFNVTIGNITSAQGFSIVTNQTISLGADVSGLGDFNQDGLDDVAVSASFDYNGTGGAYVIFGTKSQPASIDVDTLTSTQGIAIIGGYAHEETGYSISGIGDFNGDNIPDIALGTHSGSAYGYEPFGYVVYSPGSNLNPLSAGRIGYKALIMTIVAFILCIF